MSTIQQKLHDISSNVWFSWNQVAIDLFSELNPEAFESSSHSLTVALREAKPAVLADTAFGKRVDVVHANLQAYLNETGEFEHAPKVAYFCMEYGLHESLPLYSGGLGVLAGDHLKAASDLGLPLVAVGLLLLDSYCIQRFYEDGWQREEEGATPIADLPVKLLTKDDGSRLTVEVQLGDQPLYLQAWEMYVGRTRLVLLDSDIDLNPEEFRGKTRKLYGGGIEDRLDQEIILGIGGRRMLLALEEKPQVFHMNEGHCAFLALELLRERLLAGEHRAKAEEWVRDHCVFTTHTPVRAGHDRFTPELLGKGMSYFRHMLGLSEKQLLAFGRVHPNNDNEPFNMTVLAIKLSRKTNGVARLHGEVSRHMMYEMWPHMPINDVPITHITNGVHLPTWTIQHGKDFLTKQLGDDPMKHRNNPDFWKKVQDISDEDLWAHRNMLRKRLVDFVNERVKNQSLPMTSTFHPDALTIGFARRFAPYKRADLLFYKEDWFVELFSNIDRPIQIVFAGKAHPKNDLGKEVIKNVVKAARHPALEGKVVLLEDYSMAISRYLISGADVWLNNPRRPMEASGTSGQKVAMHGGLNCSILDGWWPEGFKGDNGWAIGNDSSSTIGDPAIQDLDDAGFLFDTMKNQVIAEFYDRNANGIPVEWLKRVRNAIQHLGPEFCATRMVRDYIDQIYF